MSGDHDTHGAPLSLPERILAWFTERPGKVRSSEQLRDALGGVNYHSMHSALSKLVRRKLIQHVGHGRYALNDGTRFLPEKPGDARDARDARETRYFFLRLADALDGEIDAASAAWALKPDEAHYFTREAVKISIGVVARALRRIAV
jgi:hypothetical protein